MWERPYLSSLRHRLDPNGTLCGFNERGQSIGADGTLVNTSCPISHRRPVSSFIKLVVVYRAYSGKENNERAFATNGEIPK